MQNNNQGPKSGNSSGTTGQQPDSDPENNKGSHQSAADIQGQKKDKKTQEDKDEENGSEGSTGRPRGYSGWGPSADENTDTGENGANGSAI